MRKYLLFIGAAIVFIACKTAQPVTQPQPVAKPVIETVSQPAMEPKQPNFLEDLMGRYPQYFEDILKNRQQYRVQIIYTQIDRRANNSPVFTSYDFNVDANNYFYPASTVKMPVAMLALEEINKLKDKGVTRSSSMITEADYSKQTPVYNDPTTPDGRPTLEHYIKKIFLVSDNDAFNRLYEFVGKEQINKRLNEMGYSNASILHRLEISMTEDENRHTNPVRFYDGNTKLLYDQPMRFNTKPYPVRKDSLGNGYYSGGVLMNGPMDFSKKNKITLTALHDMLRAILFPGDVKKEQRFQVADEDLKFVWKYMSMYPNEAGYPPYDTANYHDAYCKFLYWGSEKGELPKNLRIFNKVGDAYGFLTDVAYVVDFDKKIEFMVSATIYCNSDGILNDSKYDYDKLGFPFMKNLGKVLYEFESKREKKRLPDLNYLRH